MCETAGPFRELIRCRPPKLPSIWILSGNTICRGRATHPTAGELFCQSVRAATFRTRFRRTTGPARPLALLSPAVLQHAVLVLRLHQGDHAAAGPERGVLSYLEKELDLMKREFNPGRKVVQLHLGGGTPTF